MTAFIYRDYSALFISWLGAIRKRDGHFAPSRYYFDKNLSSLFIASFRESKE